MLRQVVNIVEDMVIVSELNSVCCNEVLFYICLNQLVVKFCSGKVMIVLELKVKIGSSRIGVYRNSRQKIVQMCRLLFFIVLFLGNGGLVL